MQHEYKGNLISCLKCFKSKSDPIHLSDSARPSLLLVSRPEQSNLKDSESSKIHYVYEGKEVISDRKLFEKRESTGHIDGIFVSRTELFDPTGKVANPICPGHTCPSCKTTWNHNYDCGKVTSHGLCENCAQQTAALISRPGRIEELGKETDALTPREQKELHIAHEEFIVLNMLHLPDGSENPNWQEDITKHLVNLKELQLKYRIYESATRSVRAKQEVQDLNKLTDEEREQYKRDASKPKKEPKKEKAPPTGNKREKNIMSMLKLMGKDDTPENRRFITHDLLGEE